MKDDKKAEQEKLKTEYLFTPLNNVDDLRNWMITYLGIDFPKGVVYPGSTHAPADAMWRIYELIKTGESEKVSEVVILSSRMSYKTLGVAAIETLCMLHFRLSVAHMAAIKSQSSKAIQYINSFFRKLSPYLEANGWKNTSDSKSKIEWITDEDETVYLQVIVASVAGANCFDPDTIVINNKGEEIFAKNVKAGDFIKSYDIWEQKETLVQIKSLGYIKCESFEYVFEDGSNIILNPHHKVFSSKGWVNAGHLKVGDCLLGIDDKKHYTLPKSSLTKVSWDLNSMIYGTLMGDASIQRLPSGNCRYQVFHCKSQLGYLQEIQKTFLNNGIKATIIDDSTGYKLYTQIHEHFKEARKLCYPNDKKTLSLQWMSNIDNEALAFLMMDDGTAHTSPNSFGKRKEHHYSIALMTFSEEELNLFIKRLNFLGYKASIRPFANKYIQISIPLEDSRKLSDNIYPYFVDSLKYKILFADTHYFYIDSGKFIQKPNIASAGFQWEDSALRNRKKGIDFRKKIKSLLTKKIKKINILGTQRLLGLTVLDENFNKRGYLANCVLVHNSEHCPILAIDEIDCIQDPRALKEAKFIPASYKGYFPLTIYLSTRKYAGGLMEQTVKAVPAAGGEILRWNILDVCERISKDIAKVKEPKVKRYITRELPMSNISPEEYAKLTEEQQVKYEEFMAYAGIANDSFLPVMRNYLVDRPAEDRDNLYFRLSEVKNNFKKSDPDTANAQLLCNKPSSSGLIYPHFSETENVLTIQQAICRITGQDISEVGTDSFEYLIQYMKDLGVVFVGGGDWGFTNFTSLPVLALIPNGEIWQVDLFIQDKLELDDIVLKMSELMDIYGIKTWYLEQAYPAYIKTMKRVLKEKGVKIPSFVKDIEDGITAIQSKIIDAQNIRKFYILKTPNNKFAIDSFGTYMWALDGKGEIIEGKPQHDSDGVSDFMDGIRYPFQVLFSTGGKKPTLDTNAGSGKPKDPKQQQDLKTEADDINKQIMSSVIGKLATNGTGVSQSKGKKKIFWV